MRARTWPAIMTALVVALFAILVAVAGIDQSYAQHATPGPAVPPAITSEVLGAATPAHVANPELALSRVTIMPGAAIPVHSHPGTQIAIITQGELTYAIITGAVTLYRADAEQPEPQVVGAGATLVLLPGDVVVESPGEVHQGRNEGATPVIIYLSTLFPAGSPRSIVVEATPAP